MAITKPKLSTGNRSVNNRPRTDQRSLLSRPSFSAKVFKTYFCMDPFFSRKIFQIGSYMCLLPFNYTVLCWYENLFLHFLNSSCSSSFPFLIIKHNMIDKTDNWNMLLNRQNYVVIILVLMLIANKSMLTENIYIEEVTVSIFLSLDWYVYLEARVNLFSLCSYIVSPLL